jgi:drug/metabolite transporter (DMT)-like permease
MTTALSGSPANASTGFVALHLAGCAVGWGTAFLFMKLIGDGLPPVVIAALRALGASAALMVAVAAIGGSLLPKGREWRDWLVLGTVNGWGPNILVAYALTQMDSGPAALIQASGPLMTAILIQAVLPAERLTGRRLFGILVGLVGMALLIGPQALQGGATWNGTLAMLVLTVGYAIGNVYTRMIPDPAPVRLALGQQTVSGIAALAIALATVGGAGFANVADHATWLIALSLLSTAFPIWVFMRLITAAGAARASMTGYLIPTVAVIVGVVVLGEPIVPRQILGGAIVLAGIAIVSARQRETT